MGLREEIAKKIQSAEVRGFDNLVFEEDTVYIRELSVTKLKYGYETIIEMIIIVDKADSNLLDILKGEIGMHGAYGNYFIQLIDYSAETPVLTLDKLWTQRVSMKIKWEEI